MATREEIKDSISVVFDDCVPGGILPSTVRSFMLTFLASVRIPTTVDISTTPSGGVFIYQNDDLIDSPGVTFISHGLQDSGFTFNEVTGTISWAFEVVATGVVIYY